MEIGKILKDLLQGPAPVDGVRNAVGRPQRLGAGVTGLALRVLSRWSVPVITPVRSGEKVMVAVAKKTGNRGQGR